MTRALPCVLLLLLVVNIALAGDGQDAGSRLDSYFSAYKPNYIDASTNGGENSTCDVKFQLSFKQRLAPPLRGNTTVEQIDKLWYKRFYFGYTQRSFWDICRKSTPFQESEFAPEIFHMTKFRIHSNKGVQLKKLQVGAKHESNAKGGVDSRSWNRLYGEVEYVYGYKLPGSLLGVESPHGFPEGKVQALSVDLEAWYIVDTGDENHDIEDYLGYSRLTVRASTKSEQLVVSGWVGTKGKASVETDLILKAVPLLNKIPWLGSVLPARDNAYFWHMQYFNGYGDELVRYNKRQQALRLGLLFTY